MHVLYQYSAVLKCISMVNPYLEVRSSGRAHIVSLSCSVRRPHLHRRMCSWFVYISRYLISFYFELHQQLNFEVIISMLLNQVWNEWKLLRLWPIFPVNVHVTFWVIHFRNVCMSHRPILMNMSETEVCSKIRPHKILWHLLRATGHKISYWNFTGVYTVGVNIYKN